MTSEGGRGRSSAFDDDGAALVEFAFILPILVIFLFGIVQFGIAYDAQQTVTSAARQGARFAIVENAEADAIEVRVRNVLAVADLDDGARISITPDEEVPCEERSGDEVVVLVEIDHVIDIPFLGRRDVTIDGESVYQCE